MSKVHYFQRYHKHEDVATNNTLHLFARLYTHNPLLVSGLLELIFANSILSPSVGVSFQQQISGTSGPSRPDATIYQKGFKILLETKLNGAFSITQNHSHIDKFVNLEDNFFLMLDSNPVMNVYIKDALHYAHKRNVKIQVAGITFEDIIKYCRQLLSDHDLEMQDLVADFEEFCSQGGALPTDRYTLRALASGGSFTENMKYNIYYDLATRGFRQHAYIGLYDQMEVKAVGKLENDVTADYNGKTLKIHQSTNPVTPAQKANIIGIIKHAGNINFGHRFFIVDAFHPTSFKKLTPYGVRKSVFFNLRDLLSLPTMPNPAVIAQKLANHTF